MLHARGVIVVVNVVGVPIDALVASTVVVPVASAVVIGILVVSTVVVASYVVVASVVVVMTATAVRSFKFDTINNLSFRLFHQWN